MLMIIDPVERVDRTQFETASDREEAVLDQIARTLRKIRRLDPAAGDNVLNNLEEHLAACEEWADDLARGEGEGDE